MTVSFLCFNSTEWDPPFLSHLPFPCSLFSVPYNGVNNGCIWKIMEQTVLSVVST